MRYCYALALILPFLYIAGDASIVNGEYDKR